MTVARSLFLVAACCGCHGGSACRVVNVPADAPACSQDADCGICHDGSSCGTVMARSEIERRGDECQKRDSALCECAVPACCSGHCVVVPCWR